MTLTTTNHKVILFPYTHHLLSPIKYHCIFFDYTIWVKGDASNGSDDSRPSMDYTAWPKSNIPSEVAILRDETGWMCDNSGFSDD